jgi:hypothetical protein
MVPGGGPDIEDCPSQYSRAEEAPLLVSQYSMMSSSISSRVNTLSAFRPLSDTSWNMA